MLFAAAARRRIGVMGRAPAPRCAGRGKGTVPFLPGGNRKRPHALGRRRILMAVAWHVMSIHGNGNVVSARQPLKSSPALRNRRGSFMLRPPAKRQKGEGIEEEYNGTVREPSQRGTRTCPRPPRATQRDDPAGTSTMLPYAAHRQQCPRSAAKGVKELSSVTTKRRKRPR